MILKVFIFALCCRASIAGLWWTFCEKWKSGFEIFPGWKPYNYDDQPAHDGISAGINEDGDESYVGLATYKGVTTPCELIISGPHSGIYTYFDYSNYIELFFQHTAGFYYAKEKDCVYKWKSSSEGSYVPNVIRFYSSIGTFYVGRILEGKSYHAGQVDISSKIFYYKSGGGVKRSSNYEVLVCDRV